MGLRSYLKLVEIQTKVASVIPFLAGSLFAYAWFGRFRFADFGIMLVSLLCIDMATTSINNYMDYKRAFRRHGYGYEVHNAIVRDGMSENYVRLVIGLLLAAAVVFGLWLFRRNGLPVLLLGSIAFAVGVLYSFGPVPISRTPFGELFSGGIMGFFIPFLAVYIQAPQGWLVQWSMDGGVFQFGFRWYDLLVIAVASLPFFAGIANIMLANNLCDLAEDLENRRYTLPIYIGTKAGLSVFAALYALGYLAVIGLVAFRAFPWYLAAYWLTLFPVLKNVAIFNGKQEKASTFILAVKNFVLQGVVYCGLLAIWVLAGGR